MNSLFQLIGLGMGIVLAGCAVPAIAQSTSDTSSQVSAIDNPTKAPADNSSLSGIPQPELKADSSTAKPTPSLTPPATAAPAQTEPPVSKSAQNPASTPQPTPQINPAPVTPLAPTFPVPSQGILTGPDPLIPTTPIGPAKPGAAPDYLNPSPNPLSVPTRPEEVRLRGIQPITLLQALELAKRNSPTLQTAIFQYDRSRAQVRQAQAALYPSLSAVGSLTQSLGASGELQVRAQERAQRDLPPPLRQPIQSNTDTTLFNGSLQLAYNIFTSGRRPAQIRAADAQLQSDQLQVEVTWQQLQLDVSNAYYNLQQADEAVRIAQAAVRNAESSLRDTVALERAGLGTRFDVLQAQVQLANNQQQLTSSLGTQQINRRTLAQILSISPSIDLAAADPVQIAGRWPLSLEETIVLAFRNRAELEQFLAQRQVAEQQKKAILATLGPTLALNVQYDTINNVRTDLGFGNGYAAALQMQWNFFQGGAVRAQANQQEANKAIAESNFANARNQIRLQVETAYSNLGTTFQNIDTSRQAVVAAREALRLARLRFQAGVGTQTDVVNSENNLTNAEGNLVNSILGYNRALAQLTRAVTNLPIATGSTVPSIPTDSPFPGNIPGTSTPSAPVSPPPFTPSPPTP